MGLLREAATARGLATAKKEGNLPQGSAKPIRRAYSNVALLVTWAGVYSSGKSGLIPQEGICMIGQG